MPHLGVPELGIILVIVIIIFGVGKLPQIGGAIGQSIREFRDASRSAEEEDEDEKEVVSSSRKRQTRTARPKQEVIEEVEEEIVEEEEQS